MALPRVQRSWRSAARSAVAALAMGGISVLASMPAGAQDLTPTPAASTSDQVTVNTNCRDYKPGVLMADTECEILKGKALDAQARALNKLDVCISELSEFKKHSPDRFKDLGKITRDNACEIAARIKPSASIGALKAGS
jgi:hypothetical protein